MDDPIPPDDDGRERPNGASVRRRRWWGLGALAAVGAFVASVIASTGPSSVPVGGSGSMPGMTMSMGDGQMAVTMRDVAGRTVRLPGGRVGVVVFAGAHGCASCIAAVRAATDAVRGREAQLIVVFVDSATSRAGAAAFARSVGQSPARYVVDDRNGGLALMLGASDLGDVIVYDAQGAVVAHPAPRTRVLATALRDARARSS